MPNDLQLEVTSTTPDLELVLTDYVGSAYSPQVEVEDIDGGHNVSITHKGPDGIVTDSFDVMDGVSPTVNITSTTQRHTITITDAQGPHVYEVDTYADEELARATAENGRASAESARVLAESARANAETGRSTAESARDEAESARSAVEATRAENEGTRVTNEAARANAEIARNASEQAREQAETSREAAWVTLSEQATTATQAARNAAQAASQAASDANDAAQAASQTATSVDIAEQGRVQAEQARVTAEQGRATAEQGRVSAETARATEWAEIESDAQSTITAAESATEAATDAAALATRAAAATWNAGNVLKGTLAEGTVLTADDAWAAPPESVSVYGKSTQVQTTGKNLLSYDPDDWQRVTGFEGTPNTRFVYAIPLAAGESVHWHRNTTGGIPFITGWMDDPEDASTYVSVVTITNMANYTYTSDGTHPYLAFTVTMTLDFSSLPIREAQVESGTEFTSYEPWSGGTASPRPDWPQEIKSVDDLTLCLFGKQLIDWAHPFRIGSWYYNISVGTTIAQGTASSPTAALDNGVLTVTTSSTQWVGATFRSPNLPNGTYKLSTGEITSTVSTNMGLCIFVVGADNKCRRQVVNYADGTTGAKSHTITLSGDETAICFSIGSRSTSNITLTVPQPQLEVGSTITEYQPYIGQSVQIPLGNNSVRSLPDGTRDQITLTYQGPSTEHEGWGVFSKVLTQNTNTYTVQANLITGTSDIGGGYIRGFIYAGLPPTSTISNVGYCTHAPYFAAGTMQSDHAYVVGQTVVLIVSGTTVADLQAAYDGAELIYHLATPIITTLDPIELPILPSSDVTAWADGGSAQPTLALTYEQDINIVIGELRAALADTLTS